MLFRSLLNGIRRAGLSLKAAGIFAKLYLLPTQGNELPDDARMAPAW